MQTVLDAHLHLERVDHLWEGGEGVDGQVQLLRQVRESPHHHHPQEIPSGPLHRHYITYVLSLEVVVKEL